MANCVWQLRQTKDDPGNLWYRVLGEMKTNPPNYFNQVRMKISIPVIKNEKKKSSKKASAVDDTQLYHSIHYYESILKAYFRLNIDLGECYTKWSQAHRHFKTESNKFHAIRVLDQDPVENLFSFICSQNNHISR